MTICETISGDGCVLPPVIIVTGVIHQEWWFRTTYIEDGILLAVSDTGYSSDMLSLGWLKHFEQAQIKAKRKALLTAVATMRRDTVRVRTAQKKLKKLCKQIRVKAKAWAERLGMPV